MTRREALRWLRWVAVAGWAVAFGLNSYDDGIHFDRTGLLVWLSLGLVAASIGSRRVLYVVVDFLPFGAVLVGYDLLRGAADRLGMPTWWQPQVDVDKFFFFGTEPTVWLQEHLKHANPQWWDVATCLCYISFFFVPYVLAAICWLRSRELFYRWALRFVSLSFLGFAFFALIPAAPPWAAARCTASQVADHPSDPICMKITGGGVPHGGLLGPLTHVHAGANPWIERISYFGFGKLHLSAAGSLLKEGQGAVDLVAAVPSLHAGGTMLFVLFIWKRVNRWWRPLLAAYPIAMAFSLMYSAEHYFADILAGWLLAVAVHLLANRVERRREAGRSWLPGPRSWRKVRATPDILELQPEQAVESQCLPIDPLPETTPSST